MHSNIKTIAVLFIAIILAYRCSVVLKTPTALDAQSSGTPLDSLIKGREDYIVSCGSCHNLYLPQQYTNTEWKKNILNMQMRAKINDEQAQIILLYLSSVCKKENK